MKFINPVTITDAILTSSTRAENDYSAWSSGTTYAAGDLVISTSTHRIYESSAGANLNHNPTTDDGTWWVDVGPTNRWAMFDRTVGSVTSVSSPLTVVLEPGAITALALLDLQGANVDITLLDAPAGAEVYSATVELVQDDPPVTDAWSYFTSEFVQRTSVVLDDLPYYAGCELTVAITSATTAACGTLAVGRAIDVGTTLTKPRISITDYSRKATDDYGVTSVVERAYAKRVEADLLLDTAMVDYIAEKLTGVRATPVVWIGDEAGAVESMTVYGWVRDWDIVIAGPEASEARLTIEGLV